MSARIPGLGLLLPSALHQWMMGLGLNTHSIKVFVHRGAYQRGGISSTSICFVLSLTEFIIRNQHCCLTPVLIPSPILHIFNQINVPLLHIWCLGSVNKQTHSLYSEGNHLFGINPKLKSQKCWNLGLSSCSSFRLTASWQCGCDITRGCLPEPFVLSVLFFEAFGACPRLRIDREL